MKLLWERLSRLVLTAFRFFGSDPSFENRFTPFFSYFLNIEVSVVATISHSLHWSSILIRVSKIRFSFFLFHLLHVELSVEQLSRLVLTAFGF